MSLFFAKRSWQEPDRQEDRLPTMAENLYNKPISICHSKDLMSRFPLAATTVMRDNMHLPIWLKGHQNADYIFII